MTRASNASAQPITPWGGHQRLVALLATLLLAATALVWPAPPVAAEPDDVEIELADGDALSGDEGDLGAIGFVVTLDTPSASDVILRAEVTGRTGNPVTPSDDFGDAVETARIAAGSTSGRVAVTVVDDDVEERNEGFTVTVTATREVDSTTLETEDFDGTIRNDDDPPPAVTPTVSIASASGTTEGAGPATFRVERTEGRLAETVSVGLRLRGSAADDIVNVQPRVTFEPDGPRFREVPVVLDDDDVFERPETLTLQLVDPDGVVIDATADERSVQVADDDAVPSVSVEAASAVAGEPLEFRVTRTGRTDVDAVVRVAVSNLTTTDADWTGPSSFQVTVSSGNASRISTARVGTAADGDRSDEQLQVSLSAIRDVRVRSGDGTAAGTILATAPPFDVDAVAEPTTIDEGGTVAFRADIDGSAPDPSYAWASGDGATSGSATPTRTYVEDGEYVASVTVTAGDDSASDTVDVTVRNVAPSVAVVDSADALQPVVGQTTTVRAEVSDPGEDVEEVVFDWGDGTEPTVVREPDVDQACADGAADGCLVYQATHAWQDAGFQTAPLRVTATDDDTTTDPDCGGSGAAACRQVLVQPAGRTVRSEGPARAATAANLARDVFETADTVLVARQDVFPDALAAGPLAAELEAPLLLSRRDGLSQVAADAILDLGASRAVVLGGTAALDEQVVEDLVALGLDRSDVRRVSGANRFATAAAIAEEVGADDGTVLLALGQRPDERDAWPDALSAGAYRGTYPLLLATPGELPTDSASTLASLDAGEVIVLGGIGAIGEAVRDQVRAIGATVTEIEGADRYATSVRAFEDARARLGAASTVVVATGRKFPDGLAAGAAAAELDANLVLADAVNEPPEVLPVVVRDALFDSRAELEEARLVGGAGALPIEVQEQVDFWID